MINKHDKELLKEFEALDEIIEWLEKREQRDLARAAKSIVVDEKEIQEWLNSPTLSQARSWLKK